MKLSYEIHIHVMLFIVLYLVFTTLKSVDEILLWHDFNKSNEGAFFCGKKKLVFAPVLKLDTRWNKGINLHVA